MATVTVLPLVRHLRAQPTSHVLRFRGGELKRDGAGLAFWFRPLDTAIAEVPIDDRELPFLFRVRSADFQELVVQGTVTFRVADPRRVARRVDFSLDLVTGRWTEAPLDQVAGLMTQLAQQLVVDEALRRELRDLLAAGVGPVRRRIADGLAAEPALEDLGIEVVAVRVAGVAPTAELEKALRQPTREAIQQQADEATFARRALAVEKERAIAENELQNRIELARREEQLVRREGANARQRAEEEAGARDIAARAEAAETEVVQAARLRAERERAEIQSAMPGEVLLALALRELAGRIGQVEHLTVTPDMLTPLLGRLAARGPATGGEGA